MSEDQANEGKGPSLKLAILIAIVVLAIWGGNWLAFVLLDQDARGTFGDMFGAANALFSGLALAGVIYAILLQRNEIAVARKELRYTRNILSDQQAHLETQNFEEKFFQLIRLMNESAASIDLVDSGKSITAGRDALRVFKDRLLKRIEKFQAKRSDSEEFRGAMNEYLELYMHEIGFYIRSVYNVSKFVSSHRPKDGFYSNIIRSQLSEPELVILFYYSLCGEGRKLKPLVESLQLLRHLRDNDIKFVDFKEEFDQSAFGNPEAE